jgi:hypothetical protein
MSETYHSTFGQQIFTEVSASGNLFGRERFDMLDAPTFYQGDRDCQVPEALHLSGQDSNYVHGHPFAYASHSGPPSLPGKRTFSYHVLSLRLVSVTSITAPGHSYCLHAPCVQEDGFDQFCMASFPRLASTQCHVSTTSRGKYI